METVEKYFSDLAETDILSSLKFTNRKSNNLAYYGENVAISVNLLPF